MYSNIRAALDTILNTYATAQSVDVAWQNTGYTPGPDAYLEPFLLPAESGTVGIEATGSIDYIGLYQVNVVCPKGGGTVESRTLVDGLLTAFARTTSETVSGQKVSIVKSWASPALDRNDAWYVVPVSIRYRSFA